MSKERELKAITRAGVEAALAKARHYRVLNDSAAAESICLDILDVDPTNVEARVTHLLSITDQFDAGRAADLRRAEEAAAALEDPYRNAYYHGILCERWAKSILRRSVPRGDEMAWEWIDKAFGWYAKAEKLRTPGNDEAILRWNACVRLLVARPRVRARTAEAWEPALE